MEAHGNGGGVTDPQHGEEANRPEPLWLRHVEAVAAEAAWRATLRAVAEWSISTGEQQNAALRGMAETLGQQLEAAVNQAAPTQLQQGHELQALQQGVEGRMEAQEGAISAHGVELQNVRERAEMQTTEAERSQAAVQEDWLRTEEGIGKEMAGRMELMGEKIAESEAQFSEANQRPANGVELVGAVDHQRFARTQEDVAEVRDRLAVLETEKEGAKARVEGLANAAEKAAEEAAIAAQNVRQAAQALGDLGVAVCAQQNANETVRERVRGMEASHARQTASMAGELEAIKRAIEALGRRVSEATSRPVVRPERPREAVGVWSPLPTDPVARDAGGPADAEMRLGPVREKVTLYEGLRTPGVTGTGNTLKSVKCENLPMPTGAVSWSDGAVNWAAYLNAQIPNNTYLGTILTPPSTTVQSNVSMPDNLGISSRSAAPSRPPGLSQAADPSIHPGQSSCGHSASPSRDWEQFQGQNQNRGQERQYAKRGRGRGQQQHQHQVQTIIQPQQHQSQSQSNSVAVAQQSGKSRGQGRGQQGGDGCRSDGGQKRGVCRLCKSPGHFVRVCPRLEEASQQLN